MLNNDLTGQDSKNCSEKSISMFDIASLFIKRRKLVVLCMLVVLVPSLVILFLTPNQYCSTATILPSQPIDKFQSLKALTGFVGPRIQTESTSELYPVILRSRLITSAVLAEEYCFTWDNVETCTTLPTYFGNTNRDKLHAQLESITTISSDKNTGIISVGVETEYPGLSQLILRKYLAELEKYNLHSRKSKAQETEKYLARELSVRGVELLATQDSLTAFQEKNRNWHETNNPLVLRELARLKRDVAIKEQNYVFLRREHEAAKLSVQMDTPIIVSLDEPSLPEDKAGPFRLMILAVIGLITLLATLFLVVVVESLSGKAQASERCSYQRLRGDFATAFPAANRLILRTGRRNTRTTSNVSH